MYIIDYQNNQFFINIKLDQRIDRDTFQNSVNYLKQLFLFYSKDSYRWIIPEDRIDEIILCLEKDNSEYKISDIALNQIKEKIKPGETKFFRNRKFDSSILNEDIKLFDFQKDAIEWRLSRSNYLDSYDAGLGKTAINICVFSQLYKEKEIDSAIILVPIGMAYHWKHEILHFSNQFKEEDIQIILNENKNQPFKEYVDKKILIISNHILADLLISYKKNNKVKSLKSIRWQKFVDIKKEWNKNNIFLLADESHEFKNTKAIRTKALNSIKDQFFYKSLLSATPWINRIESAYSNISFLDKGIINMNENAFKITLAESIGNRFDRFAINSYNAEEVNKFLKNISFIFTKKIKEEIPEMRAKKIIKPIYLEAHEIQWELYKKVTEREILKLEEEYDQITWKIILNKLQTIIRVIDNPFLISDRDTNDAEISKLLKKWSLEKDPKFTLLRSLLYNYIETLGEKVVVYCIYPKNLDMLNEQFKKYNPLIVHGSLEGVEDKEKDRSEKEYLFNNSDENKLMLLSSLTSSQGLNLNKKCRRIIVYSMPWSATLFEQLSNRTHRINSLDDSIIEILCIDKTIDVVRLKRNLNRIELNSKLGKEITKNELQNLLKGII